ncbi:hypothetical protein GH741_03055 [Aquibacillus halophilus]|uniref:Uncharacterized protein n=1 Tax=Aquibacillus halophilus TaxID=930132 RepID=A0A6A8D8R6_9BACI|nr:hypothetical protein [Aquibacillus halophilus]MRH41650.1 hypothetical protein [Aquibacillus halophilus]
MTKLAEQFYESSEDLYLAMEKCLKEYDIDIITRVDHNYHFILEVGSANNKIGRLKIYYNKSNNCTSAQMIDPVKPNYYDILSSLLPIKKKNVMEEDPFMEYLQHNYHAVVSKIHETDHYCCYEIRRNHKEVWIKILKRELACHYLKGDFDLFDHIQYIVEDELSPHLSSIT